MDQPRHEIKVSYITQWLVVVIAYHVCHILIPAVSDDNDVCVWLYNCVFYMYVCLGVVFYILFFIDLYLKSN